MPDIEPHLDSPELQKSRSLVTLVIAAIVVVAICVSAWFLFHEAVPKNGALVGATIKLNMSPAEREYVDKLLLKDVALSRSENFLHQEVTVLNGTIVNTGTETVTALDVSIRFSDQMDQVVLRETRSILGIPATSLGPGQRRDFELSFEHVPPSWNMQVPTLRLVNLTLSAR
jgi:hypothetical protein